MSAVVRGRLLVVLLAALAAGLSCRGTVSTKPPIHPNQNMDQQSRLDAQEPSAFFADGRSMRPPVPGTVARGALAADDHFFRGVGPDGKPARGLPASLAVSAELLSRGQERYAIYCQPCHDAAGTGQGAVVLRNAGLVRPPTFHDARLQSMELGYFFQVVTNGVRTMPSYASQLAVRDRWAVAAYVRALQASQDAALDRVPPELAREKGWAP